MEVVVVYGVGRFDGIAFIGCALLGIFVGGSA